MVYAAKVNGQKLTFQVSGMLWDRSLVMRDVETESLWSHILGECMEGKLRGTTLEIVSSVMTTWADWKREHPETTVLDMSRTARDYDTSFYKNPERFVLGAVVDGNAVAYPFDLLTKHRVFEDVVEERPVTAVFDPASTRATLFSRKVGERVLSFRRDETGRALTDSDTGSVWDMRSGLCTKGELKGKQLQVLPAIVSFRRAWEKFHPRSRYAGTETP